MPVLGICNGFQILCEAHLLPGALIRNDVRTFVCRTRTCGSSRPTPPGPRTSPPGQEITIVLKNGEGGFVADEETLDRLEGEGQVVFRYLNGNPNGSLHDIAGICNERGNVVGLMPHPEHNVDPLTGPTPGRPAVLHQRAELPRRQGLSPLRRHSPPASHRRPLVADGGRIAAAYWILLLSAGRRLRRAPGDPRAAPSRPMPSRSSPTRWSWSGSTGRTALTAADREVLGARLDEVQVGAIAIRPRYVGDCAAAGWTTLGAGRRAAVGGLCDPQVARRPGRRLGRPAGRGGRATAATPSWAPWPPRSPGCVAAVGPGAALAAARPDGSLADYQTRRAVRRPAG